MWLVWILKLNAYCAFYSIYYWKYDKPLSYIDNNKLLFSAVGYENGAVCLYRGDVTKDKVNWFTNNVSLGIESCPQKLIFLVTTVIINIRYKFFTFHKNSYTRVNAKYQYQKSAIMVQKYVFAKKRKSLFCPTINKSFI